MDTSLLVTIVITVAGWGVTFGICKNQIKQNEKDIAAEKKERKEEMKELKARHSEDVSLILQKQTNTDTLLQNISQQLTELNTQVRLLIKGKINIEG